MMSSPYSCSSSNQIAAFWLLLMTLNNIGVTIINKALFSMVHFPYPYMLTVIHMLINYLACQYIFYTIQRDHNNNNNNNNYHATAVVDETKKVNIWIQLLGTSDDLFPSKSSSISTSNSITTTTTTTTTTATVVMLLYSLLFSMNIAIGNVSLQNVSINFNQVMRSLVPIIALYCTYGINRYHNRPTSISVPRQLAVYAVVVGVAISTIGDRLSVTVMGFIYTSLCVILAAMKVVASSELLTGSSQLQMHPLRLLQQMAPLAFIQCLMMSIITGEFHTLCQRWYIDIDPIMTGNLMPITILIASGILAFSLNICALQAYKVTSPVTCCIAAAVKQVFMVIIGTVMFHTSITPLNGFGIIVVLIASTYYSYISMTEPKLPVIHTTTSTTTTNNTTISSDGTNNSHHSDNNKNFVNISNSNRDKPDGQQQHHHHVIEEQQHPSVIEDDNVNINSSDDDDDVIELGVPLLQRRSPQPSSTTTQRRSPQPSST